MSAPTDPIATAPTEDGGPDVPVISKPPEPPAKQFMGGRFGPAVPGEKSEDFTGSTKRLLRTMGPERAGAAIVLVTALASVTLSVIGPRILGHATDVIVDGIIGRTDGIQFSRLRTILGGVMVLYLASAALSYVQSYVLAGVVQRTMQRLRTDVEEKLHRLSLSYVDSQPRGDLLSRVTNDIDNIAQSLQQTLSQLLTSILTIVGVLVMMFTISWPLALVAAVMVAVVVDMLRSVFQGRAAHGLGFLSRS